ncbi:MAG: TonB-dependent receptor [Rhodospirillaceae bacterium]|nr:TonB-dependent receptor [Rhodospirillaceae bacterium]
MNAIKRALLGSFVVVGLGPEVFAQQLGQIEEVVVTARKREERLQDVPLAITAFTADQMSLRQVRDLADIAKLTAGLNYEAYLGGNGTPVIRGAAQQRITDLDQNVSTFFDGIYLPRQYAISPGVIGLERVEVVKGPQSALYGRNAFSGAINYVTRKPGDTWTGAAEATIGIYQRYDIIADVGGPLVEDRVMVRLGAGYSEFDGDARNGHPNAGADISPGSPGRVNGWENKSFQGRIVVKPAENLELDFGAYRFEIFQETPAIIRVTRTDRDTNCGTTFANGSRGLFCGELPWQFKPLPGGSRPVDVNVDPRGFGLKSDSTILRGHAEWTPIDTLNLVYEYGNVKSDAITGGSSDRDPVLGSINFLAPTAPRGNQFSVSPSGDVKYQSHEVRTSFQPTEQWDLLAGGLYSELKDFDFFPLAPGLPLLGTQPYDITSPSFIVLSRGRTKVITRAVFGRISVQATDELRLSAEARYQDEEKSLVSGPTTFSAAIATRNGSWNQFTPRFTADYKLSEDTLLYATAARGAKAGGFNLSALVPAQFRFDPDYNWTYELGSKNDLMDGRLRLNGAVFYMDWANRQVSCSAQGSAIGITPPAVICNVGKSSVKGIELESTAVLTDEFTVSASLSYNDAKFADGVIDQRIRDVRVCDGTVCPANGDVSGNQLERMSKVQGNLGAEWTPPINDALTGIFGVDTSYKSKQYAESVNLAWLPARWLVDARAGVRAENWDVMAWVKNAFDSDYPASSFVTLVATDTQYVPIKGAGRTMGITGRYRF